MMEAELISIGDELLIGQVINTNASWIAGQLNEAGVNVRQITCVSDSKDEIMRSLKDASARAQLILITGGLGPTKDDITKQVLCDYFDTHLVTDQLVLKDVEEFFGKRGVKPNELNRLQALVPAGCTVIRNPLGTAPGLAFEKDNRIYVAMPGVPYEMKEIMNLWVLPRISELNRGNFILHRTVLTQGIGESYLAVLIKEWEEALPAEIKLAYLPSPGIVKLRLSARGTDKAQLTDIINDQIVKLTEVVSEYIWGFDGDKLESVIGGILSKKNLTLVTAESCTGGYIAHRITSIAGSSAWYKGSVIAYDNMVKESLLGVSPHLIKSEGAVSRGVAEQMAENAKKLLIADYAIAVTGIAGPTGGTPDKPVGLVWIAIATPDKTISKMFQFGDERERNIIRTANASLGMLINILKNKK